jgi:DNA-binding response OmpR family regulator
MKKILIVDDRAEVRELVKVTLRAETYQIFQAKNGQKAIDVARKEKPDLIIMDIMMPGEIDGIEATRILKKDSKTKRSVIIMLTSKGQKEDIKKGYEAGAEDYFIKPFSPLDLIKKVEDVLEK